MADSPKTPERKKYPEFDLSKILFVHQSLCHPHLMIVGKTFRKTCKDCQTIAQQTSILSTPPPYCEHRYGNCFKKPKNIYKKAAMRKQKYPEGKLDMFRREKVKQQVVSINCQLPISQNSLPFLAQYLILFFLFLLSLFRAVSR